MIIQRIMLVVGPILVALVIAGAILAAAGVDPLAYYSYVLQRGLFTSVGIQQTLTRMAPLLFIARLDSLSRSARVSGISVRMASSFSAQ